METKMIKRPWYLASFFLLIKLAQISRLLGTVEVAITAVLADGKCGRGQFQ